MKLKITLGKSQISIEKKESTEHPKFVEEKSLKKTVLLNKNTKGT